MAAANSLAGSATTQRIKHPINVNSKEFVADKYTFYAWLRENAPVYKGKLSIINAYFISRYADCVSVLKDPRFVRNRSKATGGGRMPIPMPKSVALVAQSMILEDEPEHRRLRDLVHKAFTPRALARLEGRIEELTHELLDRAEKQSRAQGQIDLIEAYALPIPVTVISEMVGVSDEDMPKFKQTTRVLTSGLSGWGLARTMFWDIPATAKFVRELIARKRRDPQDDILSALVLAEEAGDRLSEDELVSMVFLLVLAGYETTVHLITNSVATLLQHPAELERLRAQPDLVESAVEEVLRFHGPIQGTKPGYALEDVTMHGVTIPKGAPVLPLLGATNRDPEVFDRPDVFDIARSPNRHLAFGQGIHYCLGAPLARLETRIALRNLLDRSPNLQFAVEQDELTLRRMPLWHRYDRLPVVLR